MNNHFMKRGRNQRRRQGGGPNPNRALDSNGPDVRIRGTAQQIYDKYLALARDAQSGGDRVKAENYLQHAEHYFRVLRSIQGAPPVSQFDQNQDGDGDGDQPALGEPRIERPQHAVPGGDDQGDGEGGPDDQPEIPSYAGEDRGPEQRYEQRPHQGGNGPTFNQGAGPNGGDHEGRRRRRRPRRNREDGGPQENQAADQDTETTPA